MQPSFLERRGSVEARNDVTNALVMHVFWKGGVIIMSPAGAMECILHIQFIIQVNKNGMT